MNVIRGNLVLITGASSGIGAATARAMASRGATVILLARRQAELEQVAGEIRSAGGQAHVYPVDLGDEQAVEALAARIKREVSLPDVIVHSAGAGRWRFIDETLPGEAAQAMAAPYFAAFYVTRAFIGEMLSRRSGRIVIVGSPAAYAVWPGATAYTAARWALRGLAEALRADLRGTGVGVTLIVPGLVTSEYFDHNPGVWERLPGLGRTIPALTPEQVAARLIRAVERGEYEVIVPWVMALYALLNRLAPRLVAWVVALTGYRRNREQINAKGAEAQRPQRKS